MKLSYNSLLATKCDRERSHQMRLSVTGMRDWVIVKSKGDCNKDAGAWKYVREHSSKFVSLGCVRGGGCKYSSNSCGK